MQDGKVVEFESDSGKIFHDNRCIAKLNYSERLILSHLVEKSGMIVSKDKLLEIGWPGRVVVPNSLNIAVRTIRDALQSAGIEGEPETIPKLGYKLSVDVVLKYQNSDANISDKYFKNEVLNQIIESKREPALLSDRLAEFTSINTVPPQSNEEKKVVNSRTLLSIFLKYAYSAYLFVCFVSSSIFYLNFELHKPTFICNKIKDATFCGSGHLEPDVTIGVGFVKNDIFWFSERDGKYDFFKIN